MKTVEGLWSAFEDFCSDQRIKANIIPGKLGSDTRNRINFELLCYSLFRVMGEEAPRIIRKRKLFGSKPDDDGIRFFNEKLLDNFITYCNQRGITTLREIELTSVSPEIEFGLGENIDIVARLGFYIQTNSPKEEMEAFTTHLAL